MPDDRTLLVGGEVVTPGGTRLADLLIDRGRIAGIGDLSGVDDAERVEVRGKLVLPGAVDVHTHLDTPFMGAVTVDDHLSGSRAAVAGGTTTYVDYAFQAGGERFAETIDRWRAKADGRSHADYALHLAVTDPYEGFQHDLPGIVRDGVPSIKVFMAYRGLAMLDDGQLYDVLRACARLGATACVHAENGPLIDALARDLVAAGVTGPLGHARSRPSATEVEAVRRAITIAEIADAPLYFVHLSTRGAVEAVAEAQRRGRPVSGETCTHYLLLDEDEYHRPGTDAAPFVVSPPLRGAEDRAALWDALAGGTLGVVSSDHCPFCFADKHLGRDDFRLIPNGAPGIEHRLILLYGKGVRAGLLGVDQLVEIACTGPAKAFGLYPRKGSLTIGADADIVVLDPEGTTVILASEQLQRSDHSLFERWSVPGRITDVWLRGRRVHGGGAASEPTGSFLARRPA